MPLSSCEKARRYREKDPERYRAVLRRYGNKEYTCECGMTMKNHYRSHHFRTQKHKDRMEMLKLQRELDELKGVIKV